MRDEGKRHAEARDRWLSSPEGESCRDGRAQGKYLENRLTRAFAAGWDAAIMALSDEPTGTG